MVGDDRQPITNSSPTRRDCRSSPHSARSLPRPGNDDADDDRADAASGESQKRDWYLGGSGADGIGSCSDGGLNDCCVILMILVYAMVNGGLKSCLVMVSDG